MSGMQAKHPTVKQFDLLLKLGAGNAALSVQKRRAEPLLRRGWVTAEWRDPFYQFVRITPDGLRALALGVEAFGLPALEPEKMSTLVRICAKCGSGRFGFKDIPAEEYIAGGYA